MRRDELETRQNIERLNIVEEYQKSRFGTTGQFEQGEYNISNSNDFKSNINRF